MSRLRRPLLAAVAFFSLGVALLLLAEAEPLRVAAAALLLAAIACGVFAIATPELLAGDED